MTFPSSYNYYDSLKSKGNSRGTAIKRPKSIQSLKKSLFINHSNLEEFVKYIKEPTEIFHNDKNKTDAQVNGLKNIAKNIELDYPYKNKEIFMGRKIMKQKQFKRELKIQRSQLKFNAEMDEEQNNMSHSFYRTHENNSKFRITALEDKGFKNNHKNVKNRRKTEFRNTFSVNGFKTQIQNSAFTYSKFWKKDNKSHSSHKRWATQGDEKGGERSLGEITQYCEKKNIKGVNYLMLQLQMNVQDSKRIKRTTRPTS